MDLISKINLNEVPFSVVTPEKIMYVIIKGYWYLVGLVFSVELDMSEEMRASI